jgi:TorA maturation chaperone TorD
MVLHEPSEECIVDFWERGIIKNLPVFSTNLNFIKAASQLRDSFADKTTFARDLHEDYLRLFTKPLPPLAPAYESLYVRELTDPDGYHSLNVSEFYTSYGWVSKYKGKVDDDHIGIELLFLTLLIDKFVTLDDEACRGEMKNEIRRFINYHILSWVPQWNKKIQAHANTLSFKGIGNLILACAEDIFAIFAATNSKSVSTDSLKS